MDIDEIKRYIHLGHGYVEVSRNYMPEYSGICRRTFIRENKIQIDFFTEQDVALNEGESTFYFEYENFENVITSAESFLKKPVSEWTNYNRTWNEWHFPAPDADSYRKLMKNLQEHRLEFPINFKCMRICSIYVLGVFLKKIDPYNDDSIFNDTDFVKYLCSFDNKFTKY